MDKLIILSLSKKDTILLREISILTLKYTFALHATTCRALLSTVINNDEALGRQIYNYAKNIGVYSRLQVKLLFFIYKFMQNLYTYVCCMYTYAHMN